MRIYSTDKLKTNFLNQKNKPKPEPFRTLYRLLHFTAYFEEENLDQFINLINLFHSALR